MARQKQLGARPRLACEITAHNIVAARSADKARGLEMVTTRQLPEGAVVPSLTGTNIQDADALRNAISNAFSVIGGGSKDVIAVLPDAAIRVLLLDFDSLPTKAQEQESVVRFRLKKSLPFDVEQAALSYDMRRTNGSTQVVVAVSPREVVAEYERAFRDAGYSPGVVLPSSMAALGLLEGERPTLLLKVAPLNITVAAVLGQELRLIRTLDNPHGEKVAATELAETVLPSIVFFEDTFGSRIEQIYLSGIPSIDEVGPMLHEQTGARVEELAPDVSTRLGGNQLEPSLMAGVAGALLG
jgi:type IV pilus assembly protein PilM